MRVIFFLLLVLGQTYVVSAQQVFYQDICKCGVTGAGFSGGIGVGASGQIQLFIEPGSSIKKAYAFTYSCKNPLEGKFSFNDNALNFNIDDLVNEVDYSPPWPDISPIKLYAKDITSLIDPNQSIYNISLPDTLVENVIETFWSFYVVVIYENSNLTETSSSIFVNDLNLIGNENYFFQEMNPLISSLPIGLSIFTDRTGKNLGASVSNEVSLNNFNLGEIGGSDNINSQYLYAGVKGHFYMQNEQLFGLDDDTPDSLMNGTDGLADISSYLPNLSTNFSFKIKHIDFPNQPINGNNVNIAFIITNSSTCNEFLTSTSPDTTICPHTQVQLSATGGNSSGSSPAYEWWPQKDLSCYDCPNPLFSGDSSQLYTVRIWGSDSCSVVRPIMIHVRTKPKTTLYNQSNSLCADSTAFVNWQTAGANTYSLDNGAFQPAGFYNQLPAGEHLLTVRDAFGCTYDTLVLIDDYSSVVANLSVSPLSGQAPLVVQITNQSTEFTDYSWSVNNNIQPNASNSFEAFTAGEYTVQLIAWQNDPTCADTAFQTISVTSAGFYILGSSLVSASSNAQNTFSVLTNGSPIVKVNLYDVQGRLLKTKTNLQLIAGSNTIWSASELSDIALEMVLYRIEWQNAAESGELKGKVLFLK